MISHFDFLAVINLFWSSFLWFILRLSSGTKFWKIISNCCLLAFLREGLVNYASNMIRIRLNNCTIFWKQQEFLHGLNNLQKLFSVTAINRFIFSFFANQNFSRDGKAVLLCKWIALILQGKFWFLGCLVKANALASGNW